jgi:hypothetical protein
MMLSKEKATPTTSDRAEDSVLLALKERRRLEDEPVTAEADARRTQAEGVLRARAEAERRTRDEETRRQGQVRGRRFGRSAWISAAAVVALFLAVGGGLATWASRQHQAGQQALERERARRGDEVRAAQLAFDAKIRALEEMAHRYASEVKTVNDQARIAGDLQRQKQAIEAARPRPPRRTAPAPPTTAAAPRPPFHVRQKPQIDDDPMGGLPGVKSGGF